MPILTFTSSEGARGGILNSRVLIGRRLSYGIVMTDPSVSRLHAWIDPAADEQADWVITDAGSKTGTFVNEQKITRHHLRDGDVIRVGKSTVSFHERDSLPDDVTPVDLIAPPPIVREPGILFECACGAPLWVGNELAGKRGMCRHCRQPVTVPSLDPTESAPARPSPPLAASRIEPPPIAEPEPVDPPSPPLAASRVEPPPIAEPEPVDPPSPPLAASRVEPPPIAEPEPVEPAHATVAEDPPTAETEQPIEGATASPPAAEPLGSLQAPASAEDVAPAVLVDAATKRKNKCAVCHSPIVPGEEMVTCSDCAMTFHAECWQENLGCSSYGCPQVNRLQPNRPKPTPVGGLLSESHVIEEIPGTRWEPILLAASVVGSILGSVLFGGLSVVVAILSLMVLIRKKPNRSGLLIAAIVICVFGVAGGLAVSDFMWFDARHLPPALVQHIHF